MSKFKVGDKVNVTTGNVSHIGTILEVCQMPPDLKQEVLEKYQEYWVSIDGKNYKHVYSQYMLDYPPKPKSEELKFFESTLKQVTGGSELFEYTWDDYIPEGVTDEYQFFSEMAEIYPRYNRDHNIKSGGFKVCVYEGDEGPIPHVHIYYEHKGMENHGNVKTVAYVCLGTAEYAPQHKKETKVLNSKERKALVKFFSTEIPDVYGKDKRGNLYQRTCWQECVKHWIDENPGSEKYFEVDEETGLYSMPDYSELY